MLWKEVLSILESEMETPKPYGTFHIAWLIATGVVLAVLFCIKKTNDEKQLKSILGIYAITAFILELLKQIIWAVDYAGTTNTFVWYYEWYSFPFQLCSMPIYICLICLFLRKGKLRDSLLAFIAYVTILGSIASAIMPDSLFVSEVLINVHTMWLHLGSLVVSIYILMSREVTQSRTSFLSAIGVFAIVVIIANVLNVTVYNSGVLNGEPFNMFYISPHFESSLPVFENIYRSVPYPLFLIIYILAISLGAYIIVNISRALFKIKEKFM